MTCRSNCWWRDAVRLSWCLSLRVAARLILSRFFFGRNGTYIHFILPRRIRRFWHGKVSKEEAVHLQHAPIVTAQRGKTHEAAGDCFLFSFFFKWERARASARAVDWKYKNKINFKSKKKIKIKRRILVLLVCAGCSLSVTKGDGRIFSGNKKTSESIRMKNGRERMTTLRQENELSLSETNPKRRRRRRKIDTENRRHFRRLWRRFSYIFSLPRVCVLSSRCMYTW